jgi:hypothetical protein
MNGKCITFFLEGRFANNLFQYFAAKVLCKFLNYTYVSPSTHSHLPTVYEGEVYFLLNALKHSSEAVQQVQARYPQGFMIRGFFQSLDWTAVQNLGAAYRPR